MHRVLSGEKVVKIIEVKGESLSEVLTETALLVRDIEADDNSYVSIKQWWDSGEDCHLITIYQHTA